jgi:predicted O-methyltransferase YrrM
VPNTPELPGSRLRGSNLPPGLKRFLRFVRSIGQLHRAARDAKELSALISSSATRDECWDRIANSHTLRPIQSPYEFKTLLDAIEARKPTGILELGSANGGTAALFLTVVADGGTVVSVDIEPRPTRTLVARLSRRSGRKLRFMTGHSSDKRTVERVERLFAGGSPDVLFIDADHSYQGVLRDFELYSRLVKPGGLIALHDIHPDHRISHGVRSAGDVGGVPDAWRLIRERGSSYTELVEDVGQDGMGIGVLEL